MKKEIIYFTATWCGPCQKIKPIFKELSEEYKDHIDFQMIDVDEHGKMADEYKVSGIPAFFFKVDDEVVASFSGFKPEKLREEVQSLFNF